MLCSVCIAINLCFSCTDTEKQISLKTNFLNLKFNLKENCRKNSKVSNEIISL